MLSAHSNAMEMPAVRMPEIVLALATLQAGKVSVLPERRFSRWQLINKCQVGATAVSISESRQWTAKLLLFTYLCGLFWILDKGLDEGRCERVPPGSKGY